MPAGFGQVVGREYEIVTSAIPCRERQETFGNREKRPVSLQPRASMCVCGGLAVGLRLTREGSDQGLHGLGRWMPPLHTQNAELPGSVRPLAWGPIHRRSRSHPARRDGQVGDLGVSGSACCCCSAHSRWQLATPCCRSCQPWFSVGYLSGAVSRLKMPKCSRSADCMLTAARLFSAL